MDVFLEPQLISSQLDTFIIRKAILRAFRSCLPMMGPRMLDVGCGSMPYRHLIATQSSVTEYVGLDIYTARDYAGRRQPDCLWDGVTMPFGENDFDSAMATEVLEHCPEPDRTLREINRVLKPNGLFFFTVPFLWNLHEVPNDEFRYTPFALRRLLSSAGFHEIQIQATGGWHASMAQMLGLWVRRSPMSARKRRYLSNLLKPIIAYLARKDVPPSVFSEGTMISGLTGTARKAEA